MGNSMEITPERAMKIKLALLRQYAEQYNLTITGWEEINKDGTSTKYLINKKFEVQSITHSSVNGEH